MAGDGEGATGAADTAAAAAGTAVRRLGAVRYATRFARFRYVCLTRFLFGSLLVQIMLN